MKLRRAAFIAVLALAGCASASGIPPVPQDGEWRRIDIAAAAHDLRGDAGPDGAVRIGALAYRGGLHLTSDDPGFGGFSGLVLNENGAALLAVSDRGQWLEARLDYDANGRLIGVRDARMSAITDKDGVVLAGPVADAEGLARSGADQLIVSFEREARIDAYRTGDGGKLIFDRALATIADDVPQHNAGLEAVSASGDGVIAIAEEPFPSGADGYRFGAEGERAPIAFARTENFGVTDLAADGDGYFLLERAYSPLTGVRARLSRARLTPDDILETELLASFLHLHSIDNFEGFASYTDDAGRSFLYVISDDNFSDRQKTLLLMFEIGG